MLSNICPCVRMYTCNYVCAKVRAVCTFPEETHKIVRDGEDFHIRYLRDVTITIPCMTSIIMITIVVLVRAIIMTWPKVQ